MPSTLRKTALNWLARRDYSRHELARKLSLKGHAQADIDNLIEQLSSEGLINEQRFTENYIYWRRNRGYGPLRISMELQNRGISTEVIAEHLQITDNAWSTEAHKVRRKRFRSRSLKDLKEKARQQRFLQQRGFTREQIESAFEEE